jgi:hypothetical protein
LHPFICNTLRESGVIFHETATDMATTGDLLVAHDEKKLCTSTLVWLSGGRVGFAPYALRSFCSPTHPPQTKTTRVGKPHPQPYAAGDTDHPHLRRLKKRGDDCAAGIML